MLNDKVRILAVGDLHLRRNAPRSRDDDYMGEQARKLQTILNMGEEHGCDAIVFPGDVFDRWDAPHGLVEWALKQFKCCSVPRFYFVYGQHDLRYHTSDKSNSPLGVLIAGLAPYGCCLEALSVVIPFRAGDKEMRTAFYGASWGEELPPQLDQYDYHCVAMHRPITEKPLPWEHEAMMTSRELAKACPADVFICGDNHTQFITEIKSRGQVVLNMGSVMRTSIAQVEHRPALALVQFDEQGCRYERLPLMIRKHVFAEDAVSRARDEEERNEKLAELMTSLEKGFDAELSFVDNLRLAAQHAEPGVQNVISEVIDAVRPL